MNFEEQQKLLSVPGTCMHATLSCPHNFLGQPLITSTGGSLVAKAEQEERLIGFAFSALTAPKATGDRTSRLHAPTQPHSGKVSLAMDGRQVLLEHKIH